MFLPCYCSDIVVIVSLFERHPRKVQLLSANAGRGGFEASRQAAQPDPGHPSMNWRRFASRGRGPRRGNVVVGEGVSYWMC